MYGDKSSYQVQREYCRYHLVKSTVSRRGLSMQDLVGGGYFRTPVILPVSGILNFCGAFYYFEDPIIVGDTC